MKWFEAVKAWNHKKRETDTEHCWCNPRRGSKEYEEVAKIAAGARASHVGMKRKPRAETPKARERSESPKPRKRRSTAAQKLERAVDKIIAEKEAREAPKVDVDAERRKIALEKLREFERKIKESNIAKKREQAHSQLKAWAESIKVKKMPVAVPSQQTKEDMMRFYESRLKAMNPSGAKLREMLSQISGKPTEYYRQYTRFKTVSDLRNELIRLVREKEGL